ncbi:MAG: hypothetical protein AB7T74_04805 [Clostridia bacterium]
MKDGAIRVVLSREDLRRIEEGPLKPTGGAGKASWVRRLIQNELDRIENQPGQARELSAFMRGAGVCPALGAIEAMTEVQP